MMTLTSNKDLRMSRNIAETSRLFTRSFVTTCL